MIRGLWGQKTANKLLHSCRERIFTRLSKYSGFTPLRPCPPLNVRKNEVAVRDRIHCWPTLFRHLPVLRDKTAFFKGYITQDAESAEIFRGIDDVFQLFALQYFRVINLWKYCGQIRPQPWGFGLKALESCFRKKIIIPHICFVHHHTLYKNAEFWQ